MPRVRLQNHVQGEIETTLEKKDRGKGERGDWMLTIATPTDQTNSLASPCALSVCLSHHITAMEYSAQ